jgi:hypothetical protein
MIYSYCGPDEVLVKIFLHRLKEKGVKCLEKGMSTVLITTSSVGMLLDPYYASH